jgi:hypothetical protein
MLAARHALRGKIIKIKLSLVLVDNLLIYSRKMDEHSEALRRRGNE